MTGTLLQINRSRGGMPKLPVEGPVMLERTRVEGDLCRNKWIHGGPRKAVLMASAEVLDELAAKNYPIRYGSIGENLTVSGLDHRMWRSGHRYRIGEQAVIELTTLRTPCKNLNIYGTELGQELYDAQCHAGDYTSPHWAHGGFYARVIQMGIITPGAAVTLESEIA